MIIGAIALVLGLSLYTLLDALRTPAQRTRTLPKWLWIIAIIFFPVVGPLFWLFLGRERTTTGGASKPSRPRHTRSVPESLAPDDDEEYLRFLRAKADRQKRDRQRREGKSIDGEDTDTDNTGD